MICQQVKFSQGTILKKTMSNLKILQ